MYKRYFKRVIDILIALVLLFLFSPIILFTYIILVFVNRGSALFFQVRPGYQNKPFTIYKFKTMTDWVDSEGKLLPDEVRLTKVGKVVRALSLDELLQLINILKGEMSLIGPRPLLMQYLTRYSSEQLKRHNVRPGITGWAQVNGRNLLSWNEKFKLDLEYVEHLSFLLDLKILWLTFINVINRNGISADGHATMDEFWGPNN